MNVPAFAAAAVELEQSNPMPLGIRSRPVSFSVENIDFGRLSAGKRYTSTDVILARFAFAGGRAFFARVHSLIFIKY